jgi:hypothetical protein
MKAVQFNKIQRTAYNLAMQTCLDMWTYNLAGPPTY